MRPRGYTLLVVLLALLALTLVVVASLSLGLFERRGAAVQHAELRAQALADEGLARTLAYVESVLAADGDLDRVLDPGLDDTCTPETGSLGLADPAGTDHLPPFTGSVVTAGSAGKSWRRVDVDDGGAYLVRIDDDDDDAMGGLSASTTNNGCPEGAALGAHGLVSNPARDRNGVVTVTAVGLHRVGPADAPEHAKGRRAVQATIGTGAHMGIVVDGSIAMQGASHVCGAYGNVSATGSVESGCLCAEDCSVGPAYQSCGAGDYCSAYAGGGECSTTSAGAGGGVCSPNVKVLPPPAVNPWASKNAPPACTAAPCTPFHYLRWNRTQARAETLQWNYAQAGCANPRAWSRICAPSDTAATCGGFGCWSLVQAAQAPNKDDLRLADGTAWTGQAPLTVPVDPATPLTWHASSTGGAGFSSTPDCGGPTPYDYPPGGSGLGWNERPDVVFELRADAGAGSVLPRGLWFVEGNVEFKRDMPLCASLPAGWALTLVTTGDIQLEADAVSLRPAHPSGLVALAGRDFRYFTGNVVLRTCGTSAAVMVHEQFAIGNNQHLEGQLVVDNKGSCSPLVTGPAVQMLGNATIDVPQPPPFGVGGVVSVTSVRDVPF